MSPIVAVDGLATESRDVHIATILRSTGKRPIDVTDRSLLCEEFLSISFTDLRRCLWIDRDPAKRGALKATRFHKIILQASDGREIEIDELGQAVFPLLSFSGRN